MNRYGEAGQPCRMPLCSSNLGDVPFLSLIELLPLQYIVLTALQKKITKTKFLNSLKYKVMFYCVKGFIEVQEKDITIIRT